MLSEGRGNAQHHHYSLLTKKKKKAIFNLNLIKLLVLTSRLEETQVIEEQFMISQGNHETNPECVYLEIN